MLKQVQIRKYILYEILIQYMRTDVHDRRGPMKNNNSLSSKNKNLPSFVTTNFTYDLRKQIRYFRNINNQYVKYFLPKASLHLLGNSVIQQIRSSDAMRGTMESSNFTKIVKQNGWEKVTADENKAVFSQVTQMGKYLYGTAYWTNEIKNSTSYLEQITRVSRSFDKILHPVFPRIPKVSPEKTYDQIIKNGGICLSLENDHWIILLSNSKVDRELIDECRASQKYSFDDVAYSFYSRNNHKNIFRKLDYLISVNYEYNSIKLTDGYHDQIVKVKKILQEDFSNAEVLVSTVMSWLEYVVAAKFGVVEDKEGFKLGKRIQNLDKLIGEASVTDFNGAIMSYYAVFSYLSDLWNSKKQKFQDGREKIGIGRHSVQHGRVDPARFDEEVIEKLICAVYALVKLPDIESVKKSLVS